MQQPQGRRERKKAATRQALADAALRLFLEHGYEQVGIRDIAEAADVSTTTLFKHFPSKESLVFDEDEGREAALVATVTDRPAGQPLLDALETYITGEAVARGDHPAMPAFRRLVDETPALTEYLRRMWTRHHSALAHAIARDLGRRPDDASCAALARFVLEAPALARTQTNPHTALADIFDLIRHGWTRSASNVSKSRHSRSASEPA